MALESSAMLSGVPQDYSQGTVLGPIFFVVFLNDLSKYVQSSIKLSADDDLILYCKVSTHNDRKILQDDLNNLTGLPTSIN